MSTDITRLLRRFQSDYDLTSEEMALIVGFSIDKYNLVAEGWLDIEPREQQQVMDSLHNFAERMSEIDKDFNQN